MMTTTAGLAGQQQAGDQRPAFDPHEVSADAATRLEATLAPWRAKYPGVQAGWEVVHTHPARVLAGASARADLVVLGRHWEGSAVGSVTHAVLGHAHGPPGTTPPARRGTGPTPLLSGTFGPAGPGPTRAG
jgi:hypothetical protein